MSDRDALYSDYPWLPAIEAGEGWDGVIRRLAGRLEEALGREALIRGAEVRRGRLHGAEWESCPAVLDVKEKYGGLRCYLVGENPAAEAAIEAAEEEASRTCEVCGEPGEMREGGWFRVLCDAHRKP